MEIAIGTAASIRLDHWQRRHGASVRRDEAPPSLACVFVDTFYAAWQADEAASAKALRLDIVRRNPTAIGFEVVGRRCVPERTLSEVRRNRRSAEASETLVATLPTFVTLAAIRSGIGRLARSWAFDACHRR